MPEKEADSSSESSDSNGDIHAREIAKDFVSRFDNIKLEEEQPELELDPDAADEFVDRVYDWRTDLPNQEQNKKFRELYYFQDVYKNIDKYRVENLRRINQKKYDDINLNQEQPFNLADFMCEDELESETMQRKLRISQQDAKFERRYTGDKMFKCQKFWLSLRDEYSHKRALLILLGVIAYVTMALPWQLYSLNAIDRHYLGWFDEREPLLAKTSLAEKHYEMHNISYKIPEDYEVMRANEHIRALEGKQPSWQHHIDKFSLSNITKRFLQQTNVLG